MHNYANKRGYIVVSSDADPSIDKKGWNAGHCCGEVVNKIDDIKYFKELI